jgi:hypothetical protein
VSTVRVSGAALQVKHGLRWRKVRRCDLELAPRDASFACAVVRKHRAFFSDLHLNLWETDLKMPGRLGSYDLLGDFSTAKNFGVLGHLWVELKTVGSKNSWQKTADLKALLETKLQQVHKANPSVEGVLLVATKARRDGRSWQAPTLTAELLLVGGTDWLTLAGKALAKTVRGRANPLTKPSLSELWDQVEWVPHPTAKGKLGYLTDFLAALGLPTKSLGKRSKAFNKILAKSKCTHRLEQLKLNNKAGKEPWLARKAAFRVLYEAL